MMYAAWISAGLVAVGTALLTYNLLLMRRTVIAADSAVDVTREIGQAQVRGYLDINVTKLTFDTNGTPRFELELRNLGQTPARNLFIKIRVSYRGYAPERASFVFKQTYEKRPDIPINGVDREPLSSGILGIPDELDRAITEISEVRVYIGAFGSDIFGHEISAIRFFRADRHKGFVIRPMVVDREGEGAREKFDLIKTGSDRKPLINARRSRFPPASG